jgi:hypothetical protein
VLGASFSQRRFSARMYLRNHRYDFESPFSKHLHRKLFSGRIGRPPRQLWTTRITHLDAFDADNAPVDDDRTLFEDASLKY